MQPRPRNPHQGRRGTFMMMSPGPYGGYGQFMVPYNGGGQMMGFQHQQQHHNGRPMMGQMAGRGQGRRNGGGLLSKILGGKNQSNQIGGLGGIQSAGRGAASGSGGVGSILQTLSNPNSLQGFLTNTQQVLKTAQSLGPMIQQYGPIVKNLPIMWKLYKGFKDLPSGEETTEEETSVEIPVETPVAVMEEESSAVVPEPESVTIKKIKKKNSTPVEAVIEKVQHSRNSIPRLYI